MIRVLLINPPAPERLGGPALGLQYLAAALLARGCAVRVIDAAARRFRHDAAWIAEQARAFAPHIVGVSLNTRWVWHAYRLADRLRGRFPLLVAGGAHATARPDEVLERGFDLAVAGEGEQAIVRLVDAVAAGADLAAVAGVTSRDGNGQTRNGGPAAPIADLDALAMPHRAASLFDPAWYDGPDGGALPSGMITSRGCPARCTFCANQVTGRVFRHRSAANVVAELAARQRNGGAAFVPFWDDAMTADRARLLELCAALRRDLRTPIRWSAITRANMVDPELLHAMKEAGLAAIDFGIESGDDAVLRAIKKGVRTDQAVRALEWAKAEGLRTTCNFMLGFPQETPAAPERTLRFMERIAPLVDSFNTLGVVVPFPGTPLYDACHAEYGFTDWWLREDHSRFEPPPRLDDFAGFHRRYVGDPTLDLDFFRYSEPVRDLIRAGLRYKAEHNLRAMGLLDGAARPAATAEPS